MGFNFKVGNGKEVNFFFFFFKELFLKYTERVKECSFIHKYRELMAQFQHFYKGGRERIYI